MWGRDPRSLMFAAAGLDVAGQLILLLLLVGASSWLPLPLTTDPLALPWGWALFCLLLYPCLGWLFGSYTVLRWGWMRISGSPVCKAPASAVCSRWFPTGDGHDLAG